MTAEWIVSVIVGSVFVAIGIRGWQNYFRARRLAYEGYKPRQRIVRDMLCDNVTWQWTIDGSDKKWSLAEAVKRQRLLERSKRLEIPFVETNAIPPKGDWT
jgi:hypothetical protein